MVDHCNRAPAPKYLTVFDSQVTALEEKANGMWEFMVTMATAVVSAELGSGIHSELETHVRERTGRGRRCC